MNTLPKFQAKIPYDKSSMKVYSSNIGKILAKINIKDASGIGCEKSPVVEIVNPVSRFYFIFT